MNRCLLHSSVGASHGATNERLVIYAFIAKHGVRRFHLVLGLNSKPPKAMT